MFKKKDNLVELRLEKLEHQVFAEKNEEDKHLGLLWAYDVIVRGRGDTLVNKTDSTMNKLNKLQDRFDLLLKHFELEYHKITDENGSTKVKECYKKAKKVKTKKKYEYEEDADEY